MHTLDEIMGKAPVADNSNGATPTDVLSGRTFWGLQSGAWGLQTGTVPAGNDVSGADGSKSFAIPDGLYSGSKTATANDAGLVPGNIKDGMEVFGVTGNYPLAGVQKTGQSTCYDISGNVISCSGTGQDGEYQKGVTWPNPRFTDNGDWTVTDNLTGLIWVKWADCALYSMSWQAALDFCAALYDGCPDCSPDPNYTDCILSDNSNAGDWRLPNVKELLSLVDYGRYGPALPSGHPFMNVRNIYFWTSTSHIEFEDDAWVVGLGYGNAKGGWNQYTDKSSDEWAVWCVRGGR
jgi:hypothetical protein